MKDRNELSVPFWFLKGKSAPFFRERFRHNFCDHRLASLPPDPHLMGEAQSGCAAGRAPNPRALRERKTS